MTFSFRLPRPAFLSRDCGSFTVTALFLLVASLMLGSIAVDVMRRTEAETDLQITVDAVAHTALLRRATMPAGDAVAAALELAARNSGDRGSAIAATDIEFGLWDPETRSFTPDPAERLAVRVTARRNADRGNFVRGLLTRLLGYEGFEISADAVYVARTTECARNGLVAERMIKLASHNAFGQGYCVHSDRRIQFSQHNDFAEGAQVDLPNRAHLRTPGNSQNPGLNAALRERPARLDVETILTEFHTGLMSGDPRQLPLGLSGPLYEQFTVSSASEGRIDASMLTPGRFYAVTCTDPNLTLDFAGETFANFALVTDCAIRFSGHTALEGVTIFQHNSSDQAIYAPAGVRLGAIDNCAPTGNTILLTTGGARFASGFELHGSTVVAGGDVSFAAHMDGTQGGSVISGGTIHGTSNGGFSFCDTGFDIAMRDLRLVE